MKVTTIGLDIAKQVFQVHGADKAGRTIVRRKLRRSEVARFFSEQPPCVVGIEASGSAHYWARVLGGLGHTVRLMVPQFVKPYVKSNKNDANDAEAICEAVRGRPCGLCLRSLSNSRTFSACIGCVVVWSPVVRNLSTRSWPVGRVRDRIATVSGPSAARTADSAGRRREPTDRLWPGAISESLRRTGAIGREDRRC